MGRTEDWAPERAPGLLQALVQTRSTPGGCVLAGWVLVGCMLAGCERQAQGAADIPHTPIPKVDARFSLEAREGRVSYAGVLPDPETRARVAAALESAGASGKLQVDPRTLPAPWAAALGPAAQALGRTGGRLEFAGRRIELRGELDPEQRATLRARLARLFPDYTLAGGLADVDARLALPSAGDGAALLAFLNAVPFGFHPDSGMLSAGGVDAVARAVRGMQSAGPGAPVEARIHPDSEAGSGEALALARQRSDALLTQFALRGIVPPQIVVRTAPFMAGREGQVEFAAPAPAAASTTADTTAEP